MAGVAILRQDHATSEREAEQLVADAKRDLTANCCIKRFYLTVYGFSPICGFPAKLTHP